MKFSLKPFLAIILTIGAVVLLFCSCANGSGTQVVQVRFVDENGNDYTFTAGSQEPAYDTPISENVDMSETVSVQPAVQETQSVSSVNTTVSQQMNEQPSSAVRYTSAASEVVQTQPTATQHSATQPSATQAQVTQPPATQAPAGFVYQPLNKKGDLYKAEGEGKIWAKIVGSCYVMFKDLDAPNEWGEQGKVYELYVTYIRVGENYSMWADGYWELSEDGKTLTMTPVNQSNNGNIGAEAGSSKTFTADDGRFTIPISFEQGGGTNVILDLSNPLA